MEFTVQIISLYCIFMYIIFQLCILQKEKMRTNCIKNLTLCILDKNKNKLYSHFTATFFSTCSYLFHCFKISNFNFISLFQNFKFSIPNLNVYSFIFILIHSSFYLNSISTLILIKILISITNQN